MNAGSCSAIRCDRIPDRERLRQQGLVRLDTEPTHQRNRLGASAQQKVLSVVDREVSFADAQIDAPSTPADRGGGIHQGHRNALLDGLDCASQSGPAGPDHDPARRRLAPRGRHFSAPPRGGPNTRVRHAISSLRTGVSAMR